MNSNPKSKREPTEVDLELIRRSSEMVEELRMSRPETQPALWWTALNEKNTAQLCDEGYDNFKRSVIRNYFTWVGLPFDQLLFTTLRIPPWTSLACFLKSVHRHDGLTWRESFIYNWLTRTAWAYASRAHPDAAARLEEPRLGRPFEVQVGGKLVSQDLANSLNEMQALLAAVHPPMRLDTVVELGAGSGRDAYALLHLEPSVRRYVVVDIPPALALAERYLSDCFPKKRVFRYRPFRNFSEVAHEFEQAELCFVLSSQIELLPAGIADAFINIASLQEMRLDQIHFYFNQAARIVKASGLFYLKQWKVAHVPHDEVVIREQDWPFKDAWDVLSWNTATVQIRFFEALLQRRAT